jgi:hypothetical protein
MTVRERAGALIATIVLVGALLPQSQAQETSTPEWLAALNLYRAASGTSPITEDAAFTFGADHHARYIVEEDELTLAEDPTSPWFTPEGNESAASSAQIGFPDHTITDTEFIQTWMSNAFTAPLLNTPTLLEAGFGSHTDGFRASGLKAAGVLDFHRGRTTDLTYDRYPVLWPGNATTVDLTQSFVASNPSPITGCPGYTSPSGLPISLQLGTVPDITAASLLEDGQPIQHCVVDADSYTNPDPAAQQLGRGLMETWRFGVVIPRDALEVGSTYTVSVTANGSEFTWSFQVGTETIPAPTTVNGSQSADTLKGSTEADVMYGLGGNDTMRGSGGGDVAFGAIGRDALFGDAGGDFLFGGQSGDELTGGGGNDKLNGGKGDDTIKGGGGKNKLIGGPGVDTCISKSKQDTFKSCEKKKRAH